MLWWIDAFRWVALFFSFVGCWFGWKNGKTWMETRRMRERLNLYESISSKDEVERIEELMQIKENMATAFEAVHRALIDIHKHPEKYVNAVIDGKDGPDV